MKIIELRFQNLNSLYGEWSINFSTPEYASNGIFAITGPTGAGKTTILDGICLALYGRTPRLSKITKSSNEVMSRQTGECFAEVMFETGKGRFRCHWSQHRARKKASGELQAPKHEISHADSGEILESSIRGVAGQIEAATGMDFDRFTRSMLLAQGGFAAFLQAAPDERAPILEQITGTAIYSQISIRVHERQRDEREKHNLLQADIAGIVIMEPEEEREVAQAFETKQLEERAVSAQSAATGKAIVWLNTIEGLKQEIKTLFDAMSQLQNDMDAFQPTRKKLEQALSAATQDGAYATLSAIRKEQTDDQAALKAEAATLTELESSAGEQAVLLIAAEEQTLQAKAELKTATPIIQKIRALDQRLTDRKAAVREGCANCHKEMAKIDTDKQGRLHEQKKRSDAEKTRALAAAYLTEYAQDEWLISNLTGVEEQLRGLLARQTEITQKANEHEKAVQALKQIAQALDQCHTQCTLRKGDLTSASEVLQESQKTLSVLLGDRLLREYRTEKESLLHEMAYLRRIAELQEHRAQLTDGTPCPLCGATEHPFATGNVPIPDETVRRIESLTTLITKAEDLENTNQKRETAQTVARNNLAESEKQEVAAANSQKSAERTLIDLNLGLENLRAGLVELKQALSSKLEPRGYSIDFNKPQAAIRNLNSKTQKWQEQYKQRDGIEKQIAALDGELKRLDAVIETQSAALAERQALLETLEQELAIGNEERNALYSDKSPDHEERRLTEAVAQAECIEKQLRARHHELQQKWKTAQAHVASLKKRSDGRAPTLAKAESEFCSAMEPLGFADEVQFLAAIVSTDQRDVLAAQAKALDERHTELKARQKDREARLAEETDKQVTDLALEVLEAQLRQDADLLQALRETIAALKLKLTANATAKVRIETKQNAIDAQQKECRRWENLHGLIGSADGKKYRNFAQGLTFEIMVGHANRQLRKMTDRYLLLRDEAQPLELNVVDNYQAGEIRSTKNLSGGESFIVSLALALGLSHMASKNVRVDSLFLDEGFGTLDDEALETSLETLASLQQDGKLIGVISHVSALRERISTQITITPLSSGRSSLAGPGCSRFVSTL